MAAAQDAPQQEEPTADARASGLGSFAVLSDHLLLEDLMHVDCWDIGLGHLGRKADIRREKKRVKQIEKQRKQQTSVEDGKDEVVKKADSEFDVSYSERPLSEDIVPLKAILALMQTSRYFYMLLTEESVWKEIAIARFVRRKHAHFVFKGSWRRTALLGHLGSKLDIVEPAWDHPADIAVGDSNGNGNGSGSQTAAFIWQRREEQLLAESDLRPLHRLTVPGVENSELYWRWYRANVALEQFAELPAETGKVDIVENMTVDEFIQQYELPHRPVILRGACAKWSAMVAWQREQFLANHGNKWFKTNGSDEDGHNFRMRIRDFFAYSSRHHDEKPIYLFDNKFSEHTPAMLSEFEVPEMFREDFFEYLKVEDRPDWRWFLIGPKRSGSPLHQDPHFTSAWNALIRGRKRWALYPPGVIPPAVDEDLIDSEYYAAPETMKWYVHTYANLAPEWKCEKTIEVIQEPGDVIFVPGGWWHTVLNLEEAVAVTQNFVDAQNFKYVWQDLVAKGRHQRTLRRAIKGIMLERAPYLLDGLEIPDEAQFDRKRRAKRRASLSPSPSTSSSGSDSSSSSYSSDSCSSSCSTSSSSSCSSTFTSSCSIDSRSSRSVD